MTITWENVMSQREGALCETPVLSEWESIINQREINVEEEGGTPPTLPPTLPFLIITPPNPAPPITGNAGGTNFTTLGVDVGPGNVEVEWICVSIELTVDGVVFEPSGTAFGRGVSTQTANNTLAMELTRDGLNAVATATDVRVIPNDTVVLNSLTLVQIPCLDSNPVE